MTHSNHTYLFTSHVQKQGNKQVIYKLTLAANYIHRI